MDWTCILAPLSGGGADPRTLAARAEELAATWDIPGPRVLDQYQDRGLTGSSSTSLHAKTFVVDRARVFVGSFNLDPRSARLNTEMGVLIDSPEIAGEIQRSLVEATPQHAYQVTLNQQQKLQWQDPQSGETHQKEPEAGFWKRLTVKLLSVLPIEGLL